MKNTKKYINRFIDSHLSSWMNDIYKKPLLLRGARQVGKSSSVRNIGKSFSYFLEINLEENSAIHTLFNENNSIDSICSKLEIAFNIPIEEGKTLLFLDEIQSCPNAITALRYFYEQKPNLHVIAAGSLLEFALETLPSFGVGRIRTIFIYPLSFDEFLGAMNEERLLELKKKASAEFPLDAIFHQKLIDYFKQFLLVGGMPEVVARFIVNKSLLEAQQVLDDLLLSLKSDFIKYKKKVPSTRINEVFESVSKQMGAKFIYIKIGNHLTNLQIKEALHLLILSGLVIPVTHTAANGIPLGAEIDLKKRKILLLDTGIFQRVLGLDISDIILKSHFEVINKGAIAELFFGLEWLKYSSPFSQNELYYWHRENKTANAEVDYIVQQNTAIIPVEIKSSKSGAMQSLRLFLKEKNIQKGVRFSLENFSSLEDISIYPLYAVSTFAELKNKN
ncbi:ATP-binding protein [Flavobacterium laiguense]|uniref:ATP-binding protein n=1 Tax=Flavobacterium laiguense TaxID=2169409 RepID=A0A2U1JYI8_9FLAO|nr:AAA family ATPase [Flavobacterium laiguense]PWA10290.1 ATP-binding protein [Flavobacterium laiguense]